MWVQPALLLEWELAMPVIGPAGRQLMHFAGEYDQFVYQFGSELVAVVARVHVLRRIFG